MGVEKDLMVRFDTHMDWMKYIHRDLSQIIEELGGQLLFWVNIENWDKPLNERWLNYFQNQYQQDKKFYVLFEPDELSTHTLLDIDLVVNFFNERGVQKDKLIWMLAGHNFDNVVKRYNKYIKLTPNLPLHYGDSRFSGYTQVQEHLNDCIINDEIQSFGLDIFLFFMKGILDNKFLSSIETVEVPNKLFCCPMGIKKESRFKLLLEFKKRKFISNLEKIKNDDLGWVSLNYFGRIFENDIEIEKGKDENNTHGNMVVDYFGEKINVSTGYLWDKSYIRSYLMKETIKESFFIVNVESEMADYSSWTEDDSEDNHLWAWMQKNGDRFTEKIVIPYLFRKPFFNMGPVNGLEKLKSYGFKSFSDWINEEYDKQTDLNKRIEMVLDELERLSKFTRGELIEITKEMESVVNHNYELLLDMTNNHQKHLKDYVTKNIRGFYES